MISSIRIHGYRGFEHFEMSGLARVNLLVGPNNSGKTSALEAIHLLSSTGDPATLWQLLWRRGERLPSSVLSLPDRPLRRSQVELDVSHLFFGHDAQSGRAIRIEAFNGNQERFIDYSVSEIPSEQSELFGEEDAPLGPRLGLVLNGQPKPVISLISLTRSGGLYADSIEIPARRNRLRSGELTSPALFITTESVNSDELISMWNKLALTRSEELVLSALQFLDPNIERIASQSATYYGQGRGGFIVKLKDREQPVPIGSMGDGMWRMLAMAIAITQCKGGVLLVDEIDTGLHYTVMAKMWKLIFNAAKQFDVQVFATTHSSDCVYSIAELWRDLDRDNSISLQRIEAGRRSSVPYDPEEISIAAQREIEVR
jgi:hypothetical protein